LNREYYFALRPGQRVECPRCGNMLEVGEDSSVYCDYCHYYWTLAELLTYLNGETRFPVSLLTKHVYQPTLTMWSRAPQKPSGEAQACQLAEGSPEQIRSSRRAWVPNRVIRDECET